MKQFNYVEEYLEFIAGIRDVNGKILSRFLPNPPISLARYDIKFVEGVGEQVCSDALTDRQAELAIKIITKYERQLSSLGVSIAPVANPHYRLPIRNIDRSKRLTVEGNMIHVRFPYNDFMVKDFKNGSKDTQGTTRFNRDLKVWQLALTEYNLNYAMVFAQANQIDIDTQALELMQLILDCEKSQFALELVIEHDRLVITNAAKSLIEYVDTHLGGFDIENALRVIDHAKILGITVNSTLEQAIIAQSNARVYNLMINRDSKLNAQDSVKSAQAFDDIVNYATITNRWPIYLYEPNLKSDLLQMASKYFAPENIIVCKNNTLPENYQQARVVHITKYNSRWQLNIPLLVTANGMLFGGDKQMLLGCAEKVVYLAHEVYNHSHRGADLVES